MIDGNDASTLYNYINSKITPDEQSNIIKKGFYNLIFGDDEESQKALKILLTKPVNEKLESIKNSVNRILLTEDIEISLNGFNDCFIKLNEIGSEHVGSIVKIKATINGVSNIKPKCEVLYLKCTNDHLFKIDQRDPFKLNNRMKNCPKVESGEKQPCSRPLDIQYEDSIYKNSQKLSIQSLPEDTTAQIPIMKDVFIYNKFLLDKFKSGDIVEIIGIIKVKFNKDPDNNRSTESYIEGLNIIPKRKDIAIMSLSPDEIIKVKTLANEPDVYNKLIENIAPTIFGFKLEKEAGLLALVGGVEKQYIDETSKRYWINVFLCGDPSTAKTALLEAIYKLAPIGNFTGGRGVSGVGLTSAIIHEKGSESPMLIAGMLPLTDRGLLCIDEFDKIEAKDVGAMYMALENGIVPVDKGGFSAKLMARTAVFGASNPSLGRYDDNRTVGENLKGFPIVLLSRFDLIFICKDEVNTERDGRIADRIMDNDNEDIKVESIDRQVLKNYIFYAKMLKPSMGSEMKELVKEYYLKVRKRQSRDDPVPIAPRQLLSIIRLAEAHAKIMLKDVVDKEDIDAAKNLVDESLKQTCKVTGLDGEIKINVNKVGTTMSKESQEVKISNIIRENTHDYPEGMTVTDISLKTEGMISPDGVKLIIKKIEGIYQPSLDNGKYKVLG
jgi:replicative DNA helicase Mcm